MLNYFANGRTEVSSSPKISQVPQLRRNGSRSEIDRSAKMPSVHSKTIALTTTARTTRHDAIPTSESRSSRESPADDFFQFAEPQDRTGHRGTTQPGGGSQRLGRECPLEERRVDDRELQQDG